MNIKRYIDMAIRREIKRWNDDKNSDFNKIQSLNAKLRKILQVVDNDLSDEISGEIASAHHNVYIAQLEAIINRTFKIISTLERFKNAEQLLKNKNLLVREIIYCANRFGAVIRRDEGDIDGLAQNVKNMIKLMKDIGRILASM